MNSIIIIMGPTGVGKSDLAIKLAQSIDAEIINADIGSFYTPLTIGTAKPSTFERNLVRHHMIDIMDKAEDYTVVRFRKKIIDTVSDIQKRGKRVVIVGGSTFYIKSLFFSITDLGQVEAQSFDGLATQDLWNKLYEIDQKRALSLHPHDRYRVERALSIYYSLVTLPSSLVPVFDVIAPVVLLYCTRDRDELYARINKRVELMFACGWIDEVRPLRQTPWAEYLTYKKIIGYNDILIYLEGGLSLPMLIETVQQKTRNYAKRQLTFFNKLFLQIKQEQKHSLLVRYIDEINLTLCDVGLYIETLLKQQKI